MIRGLTTFCVSNIETMVDLFNAGNLFSYTVSAYSNAGMTRTN